MKELVLSYLNYRFYPTADKVCVRGNVGEKSDEDDRIYGHELLDELEKVYRLGEEVELIIENWILAVSLRFDLHTYWDEVRPSLLPLARRLAAQTIGMDLVAVQPLTLPTGNLAYLDFNYGDDDQVERIPELPPFVWDRQITDVLTLPPQVEKGFFEKINEDDVIKKWSAAGLLEGLQDTPFNQVQLPRVNRRFS